MLNVVASEPDNAEQTTTTNNQSPEAGSLRGLAVQSDDIEDDLNDDEIINRHRRSDTSARAYIRSAVSGGHLLD